jgi:hypothetical protein
LHPSAAPLLENAADIAHKNQQQYEGNVKTSKPATHIANSTQTIESSPFDSLAITNQKKE